VQAIATVKVWLCCVAGVRGLRASDGYQQAREIHREGSDKRSPYPEPSEWGRFYGC